MSSVTGVPRKTIRSSQQARVDVEGALAARGLLDHHRNQRAHQRHSIEGARRAGPHAHTVAWGPELGLLLALLFLGRPDLLAGLGLLKRDRHRRFGDDVDRLAHLDVLPHHRVAAILAQPRQQLLRRRALVLGGVGERLHHFPFGDLDRLRRGDSRQHRLALQLALGVGLRLLQHLLAGFALHLQEGVRAHPAAGELPFDPLPALRRARRDEVVGQVDRRRGDRGVDGGDPEVLLGALVDRFADALGDVGAQLLEGVELGSLGGELVIQLGEDLFAHLFDVDREDGALAGQLLRLVILREGDLDLALLTAADAAQLLLEALDQLAAAELEQVVGRLAALERLAVEQALEVDQQHVAVGGGPLDRLELGESGADPLDLALDDLIGGLRLGPSHLQALVLAQLGLGTHADLEFEAERLALRLGGGDDLDAGIADRADPGAQQALLVPLGEGLANRLLQHGAEAEPLDHQRGRRLALAKAGHPHLPRQAAGGALDAAIDPLGGNLHLDPHARVGQLCDDGLHERRTLDDGPWCNVLSMK